MEKKQMLPTKTADVNFNLFEAFGGSIGHDVREMIPHRIGKKNKNLIICLEGWIDMEMRDEKKVMTTTLLISADNHKKFYKCSRSYPELVMSQYEAKGKAVFVLEFEALPADIREFKVIRICAINRVFRDSFIWRDVLCYVQRNESDVYTIKTAESRYVNTTLYGADISRVNSLTYYVNQYWNGRDCLSNDKVMHLTIENWRNNPNWRFSLDRFIYAHERFFELALDEMKVFERKKSHWMWFIFPQAEYLAKSDLSKFYSLSYKLSCDYLMNDYLMSNMKKILSELMNIEDKNAVEIFGSADSKKLISSLTLFHLVSLHIMGEDEVFAPVLQKYFGNRYCSFTQNYLEMEINFEVLDKYLG